MSSALLMTCGTVSHIISVTRRMGRRKILVEIMAGKSFNLIKIMNPHL